MRLCKIMRLIAVCAYQPVSTVALFPGPREALQTIDICVYTCDVITDTQDYIVCTISHLS